MARQKSKVLSEGVVHLCGWVSFKVSETIKLLRRETLWIVRNELN